MTVGAKLTKTVVEGVRPGAKDQFVWDGKLTGFGVKVTPAGKRIYVLQYRPKHAKQLRRYTLGPHGAPWTTERARLAAEDLLARVRLGEDPHVTERKQREAEAAEITAEKDTVRRVKREAFEVVVKEFIARYAKPKNRTWADSERILRVDAVAKWKGRSIRSIGRADVLALIDDVQDRSPAAARALFAQLRRLFQWCVERLYIDSSPVVGLKAPPPSPSRDRYFSDEEIALFWRAAVRLGEPFGPLFQLLLLTAQRRDEVSGMRWQELDLARAEWKIPGERAKNGAEHLVDLSPEAIRILGAIPKTSELVFTTTGETPLSGHSKAKARLELTMEALRLEDARAGACLPPVQPLRDWWTHDLRRTAATGMAALGHPPHVIEAILNHRSGARGGLVAVYQHYQHRPERKVALNAWADHIMGLIDIA